MATDARRASALLLALLTCACGAAPARAGAPSPLGRTSAPVITTAAALNGALIVRLSAASRGAAIYYTVDGSRPGVGSTPYEAPFLISSSLTVRAVARAPGDSVSRIVTRAFHLDIPAGTLLWSDEFNGAARAGGTARPNPRIWQYDTEPETNASLDTLCAYGSAAGPCNPALPDSYLGRDGNLHLIARKLPPGGYASARMMTLGHFSFRYGRLEARIRVPEGQGIWPAFWLLGDDCPVTGWPACGEIDIMERVNDPGPPPARMRPRAPAGASDWNAGTIHGTGYATDGIGSTYYFTAGATAAGWHTYGVIKTPDRIELYVDDPAHPYATFTRDGVESHPGAVWPFDDGQSFYIILNIAVGGSWPGPPDAVTKFPSKMLVDYVRLYSSGAP